MKPHLQCAEQQVSRSNLTKYCACHAERLTYLIIITYETSFTMRGATGVTIQPHQILRLSRRKTHLLSHHYIWNLIYNARSNRCHDPTSPNTAPVHAERLAYLSSSHMKRHLQCAEQQVSPSNLTKYCACHAERLTYLVRIAYETSFTVRGATDVTSQPHQILRLPRKMTRLLYRPHIWNVISNARSNRCHYPTSPNTAPATKNDAARFQRKSPKTGETSFPMRGRSDHDPSMIREWSDHDPSMKSQTATRLATEVPFRAHHEHFLLKNTTFRAQSYIQTFTKYCACHEKCHLNFTKYCACHEKRHLNFTKYCACHESDTWTSPSTAPATKSDTWTSPSTAPATKSDTWTSPSTAPATKSDTWTSPSTAPATKSDTWTSPSTAPATKSDTWTSQVLHLPRTVTLELHQVLRLPLYAELYSTLLYLNVE